MTEKNCFRQHFEMPILQHGIQVKRLRVVLVEGLTHRAPNPGAAGLISTKVSTNLQCVDYFTAS